MKKKLLLKTMLLLCALVAGSSSVWATDVLTLDCATPAPTGSTSTALNQETIGTFLNSAAGLTNEITCSAKSGDVYKGKGSGGGNIPQQCLKVGKASGGGGFTFTIPNTYDQIGSVEITCYGWSTSSQISINSGTNQTFTTAQVETTKTFELSTATRTIALAVTTSAVCITEIVLKSAVTGEATTVTINASGITNTDIASGTDAGSLSAVVKDASSNTIDGASVTWSSSKPSVATIDATTGAVTLVKKGSTTITASYAGVDGTYQPSSNTYVLNVTNSAAGDGTAANPFTVIEARDALDNSEIDAETDYYVRGYIAKKNDISSGSLTYWLSDDGSMTNNLQCYKGKNVGGADFTEATDLEVGDIATVKGKLKIYQTTTYEFDQNNEVVSITPRTKVNIATFTATTNPLILGMTETTETTVTNDQAGWTPVSYSYASDDETVATVNENGVITAVAKGTANITVTPVVEATDPNYKAGESKSIEITVKNPSHTASFSVNGVISEESVEEGEAITFPAVPATVGGQTFMGWTTAPIDGTQADAPSTLITTDTTPMGTDDVTYYAVFAKETTGEGDVTLSITSDTDNFPGSYGTANKFTEYTLEGKKFKIQQGYVNGSKLQWRAAGNSNGTGTMYNTDALKKIQSVVLTYDTSDGNKNFTVKVGESENPTSGTEITPSNSDLVYTFDCSSHNANYFVMTNGSNAGYLKSIAITYKAETTIYSDYCTTVSVTSVTANVAASGYTTFAYSAPLDFANATDASDNNTLKAYVVSEVSKEAVTLTEVTSAPANTGVVLKGNASTAYSIPVIASADAVGTNLLTAVVTATTVAYESVYVVSGGKFCLYQGTEIPAGKAYLEATLVPANASMLNFDFGGATGIDDVKCQMEDFRGDFYNINGQRVAQPTKGLYIVNGKKVIVK